jgi:ABC-type multidrug transport system ATPase subunit
LLAPKDFLLLDEPFEGFSPNTIDVVRDVLKEMAQEKLILIAEHALDVMIGMADIALVFKNGKLVRSFDSPEIRYSEVMAYFG